MLQILLVINLFLAFLLPVRDNDFGWHYRCGEKLCPTNEYSYFLPNYHWAYPGFFYDVSLAKIFNHFGLFGVAVFGAVIFTAIFLIYFFLLKGSFTFRVIFILAAAVLSWSILSLGYRSQILGLLFFVIELLILEKRKFWSLPLLFFFWANTHLSFFLGPLILIKINWRWDFGFVMFPVLISSLLFFLPKNNFSEEAYCRNLSLPCKAVKNFTFEPGNIFNTYEWGGYLVWKLPDNKIFVDGRMPAWQDENGESPYNVFLKILQTQPGWNEKLEKLNTKYIFIGQGTFLDLLLQKESAKYNWREEYRDEISAIYKRV
ncbi:hypothetical protein HY085_02055 [Candidatus Gottesmanbacteria bacterium]|nr:hypothetical protein [Candidatus Gottesmanbacteria bacterium]